MYTTESGEEVFVIDAHVHLWDGSDENIKNIHGKQFIDCFYDYHKLSPKEHLWPYKKYQKYTEEDFEKDVFEEGYADMAIFNPQYLGDFYHEGFSNIERNERFRERHPERVIANGWWDPRNGEPGLEQFEEDAKKYGWKGVKLYTAEWKGESKGWKLSDPWAYRYLEKTRELGIKNVHVHKGPTITPLNKDAFDVGDVDDAASSFQELNFIVEHIGMPRVRDFTFIAAQDKNIYAGLSVVMPFIHARPRFFAEMLGEVLYWLGPDRILFGSDYALWTPRWLIDRFMDYQLPEDIVIEIGPQLTLDIKRKILGENAARLYNIDIEEKKRTLGLNDPIPHHEPEPATAAA